MNNLNMNYHLNETEILLSMATNDAKVVGYSTAVDSHAKEKRQKENLLKEELKDRAKK